MVQTSDKNGTLFPPVLFFAKDKNTFLPFYVSGEKNHHNC